MLAREQDFCQQNAQGVRMILCLLIYSCCDVNSSNVMVHGYRAIIEHLALERHMKELHIPAEYSIGFPLYKHSMESALHNTNMFAFAHFLGRVCKMKLH